MGKKKDMYDLSYEDQIKLQNGEDIAEDMVSGLINDTINAEVLGGYAPFTTEETVVICEEENKDGEHIAAIVGGYSRTVATVEGGHYPDAVCTGQLFVNHEAEERPSSIAMDVLEKVVNRDEPYDDIFIDFNEELSVLHINDGITGASFCLDSLEPNDLDYSGIDSSVYRGIVTSTCRTFLKNFQPTFIAAQDYFDESMITAGVVSYNKDRYVIVPHINAHTKYGLLYYIDDYSFEQFTAALEYAKKRNVLYSLFMFMCSYAGNNCYDVSFQKRVDLYNNYGDQSYFINVVLKDELTVLRPELVHGGCEELTDGRIETEEELYTKLCKIYRQGVVVDDDEVEGVTLQEEPQEVEQNQEEEPMKYDIEEGDDTLAVGILDEADAVEIDVDAIEATEDVEDIKGEIVDTLAESGLIIPVTRPDKASFTITTPMSMDDAFEALDDVDDETATAIDLEAEDDEE